MLSRDEADSLSGGDPKELHYYFDGTTIGVLTNNGTETATYADDYQTSIGQQRQVPGSGPFYLGASSGVFNADTDQSYETINAFTVPGDLSRYTVQEGDTLAAIARKLWGDSSLWCMIASEASLFQATFSYRFPGFLDCLVEQAERYVLYQRRAVRGK